MIPLKITDKSREGAGHKKSSLVLFIDGNIVTTLLLWCYRIVTTNSGRAV